MDNYGYEPGEEGQADLSGSDQEGGSDNEGLIPDMDPSYTTGPDILKCNCLSDSECFFCQGQACQEVSGFSCS